MKSLFAPSERQQILERLGLGLRDEVPLEGDDAEALGLDAREDLSGVLRGDGVGLDDGECFFHAAAEYTRPPAACRRPWFLIRLPP